MTKNLLLKESVGRVALAVSLSTSLYLGMVVYDSNEKIREAGEQLGKAQITIEHQQSDYKKLEKEFLRVKSESEKLAKRQGELTSQVNKLEEEKKVLRAENDKLEVRLRQRQLEKARQEKARQQAISARKNSSVPVSSTSSTGYKNWKKMNVTATGYSLVSDEFCCSGTGLTKMETKPRFGVIAVDPNVIPLGTEVYIPAFGRVFKAEDTGGMIKGNKIDIYMNHGDEARQWGKKTIEIYVNN